MEKRRSPDSSRRSGLRRLFLPGTDGLGHLSSLPDVPCSQMPRKPANWMAKVRTMKRGSRFEFDRPLDARQALADGRGGPWRYAGLGRIPSCSGDEFRFHVVWLREMDL